jgi:nucleoid-associated protein YgaU
MQKDFKIGLLMGLLLVVVATLWLATRPSLAPQARLLNSQSGSDPSPTSHPAESLDNQLSKAVASQPSESVYLPNAASGSDNQFLKIEPQPAVRDLTIYEQAEKIKTHRFHIVRQGDTLSAISKKYYNSANKWQKILDANRSQISDANKLKPGMKLIIPD